MYVRKKEVKNEVRKKKGNFRKALRLRELQGGAGQNLEEGEGALVTQNEREEA